MKKLLLLIFLGLLTLNVSANFYLLGYQEEQLFFNQFSLKDLEITKDGMIIGGTGSMSVHGGVSILFYYNPDLPINQGTSINNNPRRVYSFQESVHDSYKW
ncbi:hypothetical protein KAU33_16735, partial [Candidatus Dependentiae bacterium]|nr:hypothetical protein [Candidatus Dependentiae bacterium]